MSKRINGFTMLEILVALLIVGTALGASLRAARSLTDNSQDLRTSMMATWSAENHLAEIRLSQTWPALGIRYFPCPQQDLDLMCKEEVLVTPNPKFRRVEVSVAEATQPARIKAKLTQLVLYAR